MVTLFDELDVIAAHSVGALLNEPVLWRPMRQVTGGYTTVPGGEPDDERPVRELEAIVSWQPTGLPVEAEGGGGTLGEGVLMIDFASADFETPARELYGKPRVHDRIELPEQRPEDRIVEITRVGDDGSERFYVWASVVTP